ncbi:MAG TPA: hypothetical protein VIV64_04895, partial [Gammaproteobacteria bacterium]
MDAISIALASRWAPAALAGLFVLAALVVAVLIRRLLSYRRQIESVRDALSSVAAGAGNRVEVEGGLDEIAAIASSVNGLLDQAAAIDDRASNVENSFAV